MSSSKDPQDWTVDELVTFICRDKPGEWSYNLACPDLVALEISLRENMISGSGFLLLNDHYVKELGIKVIAHRQYLMQAKKWLQRRSPKFQAQQEQQHQALKVVLSEDELSPEPSLNVTDPNAPLDNPLNPTTPDDATPNPSPFHDALSPAQTERKKPRRMGTTIIERPPPSSLLEPRLESRSPHQRPAPNPTYGNEAFYDHLVKAYPPNDADVLSLLGESNSESEYDTETREEMEEDEGQSRPETLPDTCGALGDAAFNEIVDEYINSRKSQFIEIRLPKEQPKGFQIWVRGQKVPSTKTRISTRLAHLEKRCQALRKALAEAQHSSRSSLLQACACLDPTVIDICLDQWKLSVLEKASPPAKIARPPRTPRPEKRKVSSDGEESLSSGLDSVHDIGDESLSSDTDSVRDTGEVEDDESLKQSEDDPEEGEIAQDEEEPRPREAYHGGPFRDYSSDEDLSHLFYKEEKYEPPAAKRRRLNKDSVHQDSPTSPLIPMTTLPFSPDVALPSNELGTESQMETTTHRVDPMRPNTRESVELASDNGGKTDEAARVLDDVYSMMWATIEKSGNRLHLIAKALITLPNNRFNQLSKFLDSYMACLYWDYARDALKNMSDNSPVIGGMDHEESHSAMLMTTLFVSWVNVIQVPSSAFTAKEVKAARVVMGDGLEEDQFAPFFECLNDLIRGYRKWVTWPSRVQPHERSPTRQQLVPQKSMAAAMSMNRAQKDGQKRQANQDEAKRDLQFRIPYEETPIMPVSFGDPVIQLDPFIGRRIQPHQLHGVQFMFREIVENKRPEGCLLAHTMGLGKTMQVISLLDTISTAGASPDPAIQCQIPEELRHMKTLILCPASLIQNWCREFKIWAPDNHKMGKVRPILAKSSRTEEICAWNEEGGILIISYDMFRNFVKSNAGQDEDLEKQSINESVKSWLIESPTLVVADEAQALRNTETHIFEAASRLRTRKRIALTGTPLSNGLKDYYWMIDWVAPKYLGTFTDFDDTFIKPIENGSHIESTREGRRHALQRQELLLAIISPKVQRMDMSALTANLPPKYEFAVYIEPTSYQKDLYNIFVNDVKAEKLKSVSKKLMSFLSLLQLCCIHPALLKASLETRDVKSTPHNPKSANSDDHVAPLWNMPAEDKTVPTVMPPELTSLLNGVPDLLDPNLSSRVVILEEIVKQAIALGDKVLVFSSSIPTLDYLAKCMDRVSRKYCLINGNVGASGRPERVQIFNNDPTTHVCLISTHAGGLGLNIQAANRVVIFDFLFNPTWEAQAIGRAFRIGQEKPVYVYRMIAGGTFEEKLYRRNVFKSQLACRVVDKKNTIRTGSNSEDPYLAQWSVSSQQGGIDKAALEKDPGMMDRLQSCGCANAILRISLCGDEIDPEDMLTLAERQTVEDELRLRHLRLDSMGSF
ncbi:hypothetical protein ACN38_g12094 [Penicillium nordicum]|uniref:Helicase C-terminal domain-containing protein n=1 Tax=Penicillium nordicum TaxID=229535 RepID=A0A0M8NRB1_9EURO|nr:hypothetical protein ACN38_g12094 [Penicillium nordicum]